MRCGDYGVFFLQTHNTFKSNEVKSDLICNLDPTPKEERKRLTAV